MTTYALRNASPAKTRSDAVVVGVVKTPKGPVLAPGAEDVGAAFGRGLNAVLRSLGVTGAHGQVVLAPTRDAIKSPLLVLVGLGELPESGISLTALRQAAGAAARHLASATSVALALPTESIDAIRAVTEGYLLGGYTYTAYKSSAQAPDRPSTVAVLSSLARHKDAVTAFDEAHVVARAIAAARDWVNEPPNELRPPDFAEAVADAVRAVGKGRGAPKLDVEIWDENRLADERCGGILAVGQSSSAPPRLVTVRYRPENPRAHLAIVGKGVTYDSGGYTIKPASGMATMKCDMGGAAAAVQATLAIAELGLPIEVTTFASMAENLVSGSAYRPGDIVTMRDGTTVEVLNTDAEGRMIMADALVLAAEAEPDLIVDIATLTGHMQMALGDDIGAAFGTDAVRALLVEAGELAGERQWPMPITGEVEERLRSSTVADLAQHALVRWGGGLMAAAFLREFSGGLPWGHLDIAGPAFVSGTSGHRTAGATGFGVGTLVELGRLLQGHEALAAVRSDRTPAATA